MPLFHRESQEERQQREAAQQAAQQEAALQDRSRRQLESGGLPVRAEERIAEIRAHGDRLPLFSSDLSVDEFLLARQSGYQPLGLVSGSSVYHIGWNTWMQTGEMDGQTRSLSMAAGSAIDRLRQEASGMGALGVVGVELRIGRPGWGEHMVEVVAIGTAIRASGAPPGQEPFLSGLSGQEFWSLLRSGVRPTGLVFGNSAFYIYSDWRARRQNFSWYNQEMALYQQSLHQAQRFAFGRMHSMAHAQRAHGVLGVHIEHSLRSIPREQNDVEWEDYVVEYLSWGTSVVEAPHAPAAVPPAMALNLEDAARTARQTLGSRV